MENKENQSELKFSKPRFFVILILALIGVALCLDLAYIFYKTNFLDVFVPSFCSVSNLIDCDGVAQTSYSLSFGVPNALWGLFVYSIILMLLFVDRIQAKFKNSIFNVFKNPRSYIATISLLTFALSMILAFISIFKINKICVLCFCTYFIDLFIAFSAKGNGFFVEDIKTTILDFIDGAKKHFILFLTLLIAFVGALVYFSKSLVFSPKLKKERTQKEFYQAEKNKYEIKGNTLGSKDAKVIIKIYSDFNCPFCKVVNIMLHKAAKEQDILVQDVNYPLDTTCNSKIGNTLGGHETSCLYTQYALAAKNQGQFWGAANVLFYKKPMTPDDIEKEFKKAHLHLDYDMLHRDAYSPETMQKIQDDIQETFERGVNGTPAIEINGVLYMGAMPYDDLIEKIKLAQKRALN